MALTVLFEEQVEIPLGLNSLADFRRWATSDDFPERGRIDFVDARIEVDMTPEEVYSHGAPKTEIIRVLSQRVKEGNLGELFTDRMRVSSPSANLSAEPDVVFVSEMAMDNGLVRLVPKASQEPDRYIELEGGPDLIVEIVSDSSVKKDTERLPQAYFRAGVQEFWLADVRGESMIFQIHHRGEAAFEPVDPDGEGFQRSEVFDCAFRLLRGRNPRGRITFDLVEKE